MFESEKGFLPEPEEVKPPKKKPKKAKVGISQAGMVEQQERRAIQQRYAQLIDMMEISDLIDLMDKSGVKIDEELAQKYYSKSIEAGNISNLALFKEKTGIPAKVNKQALDRAYERFIDFWWDPEDWAQDIVDLEAVTSTRISPEIIKKSYVDMVEQGDINKLFDLQRITGLSIQVDSEVAQKGYARCLEQERFKDALKLREITGIEIDQNVLEAAYVYFVRLGRFISIAVMKITLGFEVNSGLVQSAYLKLLEEDQLLVILKFKGVTGIAIEIDPEIIRRKYADYSKKGNIPSLVFLYNLTGVEINPQAIQEEYTRLISLIKIDELKALKTAVGIDVRVDEEKIQQAYAKLIENSHILGAAALKQLTTVDIKIDQEIIQMAHAHLIKYGPLMLSCQLTELTNVPPDNQTVQRAYTSLLTGLRINEARRLKEATGVPMPTDLVRVTYIKLAENGNVHSLLDLKEASGVEIELDQKTIQGLYQHLINSNSYDEIASLLELTSVSPDPKIIQQTYTDLMEQGSGSSLEALIKLRRITGVEIEVDSATVSKIYENLISIRRISDLKALKELTGFDAKVAPAIVEQAYRSLVVTKDYSDFLLLKQITAVPVDEKMIQEAYINLFRSHGFYNLKELKKVTDIDPEPQVVTDALRRDWWREAVVSILEAFPDMVIDWSSLKPDIDAEIYERARRISNKDLFEKAWMMFSDTEFITVSEEKSKSRQVRALKVPAHLYGLLHVKGLDTDNLLNRLDVLFVEAEARKRGAKERAAKVEFAIVNLLFNAKADELAVIKVNLERLIDRNSSASEISEILDTLAQLAALKRSSEEQEGQAMTEKEWGIRPAPEEITNAKDYLAWVKDEQYRRFGEVLGFEPDPHDYERVLEEWGDLRPIFVLAMKYRGEFREGVPLLERTIKAIFTDAFPKFRYEDVEATALLMGLSQEQRDSWIANLPSTSLGEVRVSATEAEQQINEIRSRLEVGLDQGHLYSYQNPETIWAHDLYRWIRGIFKKEEGYTLARLQDARIFLGLELYRRTGLLGVLRELGIKEDAAKVNPREILEKTSAKIQELELLLKTQSSRRVEVALSRAQAAFRFAEELLRLEPGLEDLKKQLNFEPSIDIKALNEMRSQLVLAEKVVKLSNLSTGEVRTDSLKEGQGIFQGGVLSNFLQEISTEFKKRSSAFAADVDNARAVLEVHGGAVTIKGLAIEEIDHPKALFEMGKYPTGAESCQNYEGRVEYNKTLLAAVVDADKKLLLIKKADGTIVARSMVKVVWIGNEPALFIEPTYTSVSKSDYVFDRDIDRFILEKANQMGGLKVLRGDFEGPIRVTVQASRNGVQYEDGGSGGVDAAGLGAQTGRYEMGAYEVK